MAQTFCTTSANLESEGLDRGIGFIGLLWASETSITAPGGCSERSAPRCSRVPGNPRLGPRLGIILILALVHAELGGLSRVSGGTSRFPHYARQLRRRTRWASYLQAASVAPIEVLAAIQYLSTYAWARNLRTGLRALPAGR